MIDTWKHLMPYQPTWKDEFASEKSRLQSVFGVAALEFEEYLQSKGKCLTEQRPMRVDHRRRSLECETKI